MTQTCDIIRSCIQRPFVHIAPLVRLDSVTVEQIRRLRRPAFAYIPATAEDGLVADLDRIQTVEKAIVAKWTRTSCCKTNVEVRDFVRAISRKWSRFAFPEDFVISAQRFRRYLTKKHDGQTDEALHLQALREIRVQALPSWNHESIEIVWWFVKNSEPINCLSNWDEFTAKWLGQFNNSGRFQYMYSVVCSLEGMSARDYIESD